jgi:hypothetical protein
LNWRGTKLSNVERQITDVARALLLIRRMIRSCTAMSPIRSIEASGRILARAGAGAEYRRSDYYFERSQSPRFKDLPWAFRDEPMRPWSRFAGVAIAGAAVAALACTFV